MKIPRTCRVRIPKSFRTPCPRRPVAGLLFCDHLGKGISMKITRLSLSSVSVLALALVFPALCRVQQLDRRPNTYQSLSAHVNTGHDKTSGWIFRRTKMVPALKKAGVPSRTVVSTFFLETPTNMSRSSLSRSGRTRRSQSAGEGARTHRAQLALTESSVSAC